MDKNIEEELNLIPKEFGFKGKLFFEERPKYFYRKLSQKNVWSLAEYPFTNYLTKK